MHLCLFRQGKCAAHVLPALAARQACLDLGWSCAQQPMLGNRNANNSAQVSGYLAGLVEPAFPLARWMQRYRNQPISLKALPLRFIGAGEPHRQRAREARVPAILELVNDFFD